MRFNLLILALAAFAVSTASAQKFNPGYYITASGDTVKHAIALQQTENFISKITTPEGLFLAPKDILGFGLNDVDYVVRKVSMDKTPTGGFVTDTVFLQVMSRGKMSLYYMVDENDKAHYYIENENGPQELTVRMNTQNDGITVRKVETYKSALKGIFPTCTDLFPSIDKTVFGTRSIRSIYEKLYKCRYQEAAPAMNFTAIKQKSKPSTEFGVIGGTSSASNSFAKKSEYVILRAKFLKHSVKPTGGIYIETKFTRNKSLSLRNEITYFQYEQTSNFFGQDVFHTSGYIATVGASYLKYSLIAREYFLTKRSLQPYLNVGISPMYTLTTTQNLETVNPKGNTDSPLFASTNKMNFGYFFGLGVAYKSFVLDLRAEWSKGINTTSVDSRVTTVYCTLSYRILTFGKKDKQ